MFPFELNSKWTHVNMKVHSEKRRDESMFTQIELSGLVRFMTTKRSVCVCVCVLFLCTSDNL